MTSVGIIILGTRVFTELVCCSVLSAYSYVCPWFITQYLWEEKNKNQKVFTTFYADFFFFFWNMVGSCQHSIHQFSSVQSFSHVRLFATHELQHTRPPCHHQLLESTQTHVHRVSNFIQPSHPLWSPSPSALNLSQHQGLSKWLSSLHQVAKVLEFQLQHQSFQWTPRTILL